MPDTTQPLPNIVEPVVMRDRRWNPIWYRWLVPFIQTLKETYQETVSNRTQITGLTGDLADVSVTVAETSSVVASIEDDVATISAQWGVAINSSTGQVLGLVRLDTVNAFSTFTVVADRFVVAHPTSTGDTIQAFVIGQVDGVSTVGINGDLIVDGTIAARSMAVGELSAITADIGTATAGVIQSADGKMVIDLNNKQITIDT